MGREREKERVRVYVRERVRVYGRAFKFQPTPIISISVRKSLEARSIFTRFRPSNAQSGDNNIGLQNSLHL